MKKPSKGGEIRARTNRLVESPTTGFTYLVRAIPLFQLVSALRTVPDLRAAIDDPVSNGQGLSAEDVARSLAKSERTADLFERVIRAGLVAPRIGTKDDEIEVADIPWSDQELIADAVLDLSGFNAQAAETLRPTSGVETSSRPSTPSADGTDSGPLHSSTESSGS
jgi:hypothetical protein